MKKYHIQNYVKYKKDMEHSIRMLPNFPYHELSRDQLITKFLPLVEGLARKFSTAQQASGIMTINDFIQEGNYGLCAAVDRVNWDTILEAEDPEKRLKSFLSKRNKGAIRRGIELFFNSVFTSLDDGTPEQQAAAYNIPEIKSYNKDLLAAYIKSLMLQYLNHKEFHVLRLSYGLDCNKHSAKEIAEILGIKGTSSYVRISQLKKQAITKLIENVEHSQVIDYL